MGRDPATLDRICALLVRFPDLLGVTGQTVGGEVEPIVESTEELAEGVRAFAPLGITHVQLVLDPNTMAAIESTERKSCHPEELHVARGISAPCGNGVGQTRFFACSSE